MENVKKAVTGFGLPRIIIIAFFLLLLTLAAIYGMSIPALIGDILRRWGMWGILVLAMVPGIQSGIGPNFGVSIGIIGGLLGGLISVELRSNGLLESFMTENPMMGAVAFFLIAVGFAIVISGIFGIMYGFLLNRIKGNEMTVSTYVGYSFVALFNIMWLILPFRSGTSIWPIAGEGLRTNISLEDDFKSALNSFLEIKIGDMIIPTGLLLVFFLFCFIIWVFMKSRHGTMMSAAGANPGYAQATGINVNRMRVLGTTLSTILGGVGVVCYAQSYGFLQLYNFPLMMGFSCVASVLIGGATIARARIFNVLLGALLFHGLLVVAIPVANNVVPEGNLSEVLRIIISNGIILYALSKAKGGMS